MEVGHIMISPISDGTFSREPELFRRPRQRRGHGGLFDRRGQAWLPIGCFLVRTGDRWVLVDSGMGPTATSAGDQDAPARLIGGQLPFGLRALGVDRDEITDVVCTHLHPDHVGWLFDLESKPSFPNATIWFGAGDWDHFIEEGHAPRIQEHVHQGLRGHAGQARLRPVDRDTTVAPGSTRDPDARAYARAPVRGGLLGWPAGTVGDVVTCPVQLDDPTWHSIGDVDPDLADRTRERLWRELEGDDITATGAHFPELKFGRVLRGNGKRRWT
jgi:Metallo-beta-lactamase superfamily